MDVRRHNGTVLREQEGWSMTVALSVLGLDHVVINSQDVERSLSFYCDTLGLQAERVEEWRRGEIIFPSVRIDEATIIDILSAPRTGENMNHLCLTVDPTDFEALKEDDRLDVVDGPDLRHGARGNGVSLYVRDPDDNIIELRYYE
jgi:catechol 2,3-dioxygenase-like lactoylglutathione lyase family enzyme